MKTSTKFILLFSIFTLFFAQLSAANPNQIRSLMQKRDAEIKTLMGPKGTKHTADQTQKLKSIINDMVDFEAMAKTALQDSWNQATPAQRIEFVELFSKIIRDQSLAKPDIYRASVTYEAIDVKGQTATVKTIAVFENVKTPVTYTMVNRNNTWYITDIIIDNVSTAASYQRSFQSTIRKNGFSSLIDALRKRAERA